MERGGEEEKKWRKMAGRKRKGGRKRHISDKTARRLWEVTPDGSGCGLGSRVCSVSANIVQRAFLFSTERRPQWKGIECAYWLIELSPTLG